MPEPETTTTETPEPKRPPVAPKNCPTCGWPAEGQVDSTGKVCCWFCKRHPLPVVLR